MPELTHRTIVVTGAAGGIGLGIADHLAQQGATVYGLDLSLDVEERVAAVGGTGIRCDITDPAALVSAFAIASTHGPVSGLVTAAGIHRPAPFLEATLDDLEALLKVNLIGTFAAAQCAARIMVQGAVNGSIVTLSSIGFEHVTARSASYAASKGAVASLTRGMAVSLAEYGIRVNAIAPGPVETPMNAAQREDPAYVERMIGRVPMGRQGVPSDIATAAAFLLSDGASWITGEVLRVDGGVSVLR